MSLLPVSNGSDGRDGRGRFTPGNQFGHGNPAARRMHELRQAVLDCLTPEDIRRVVRKLLDLAEAGDTTAIRLTLEYAIGRPVQAIELSGPDAGPLGSIDPRLARLILEAVQPFSTEVRVAIAAKLRDAHHAGQAASLPADASPAEG